MFPQTVTRETITLAEMIDSGVELWDFDYPSYYKGEEKRAFEQKVTDHFLLREIGAETVGRFKHYFRCVMREIMPYYIQRYESQAIMAAIDDPFGNVNVTETFSQTSKGQTTNTQNTTSNATQQNDNDIVAVRHDTPQGKLAFSANLSDDTVTVTHATEVNQQKDRANYTTTDSGETTGTGETTGEVTHTLTRVGNQGVNTYAHDMKELREIFLNIDMEVISELEVCFMGVF